MCAMKSNVPIVVLLGLGFMGFRNAKAQEFGVTGGLDISSLTGRVYSSPTAGFVAGGYMRYELSGKWSLEPEVLFSEKGGYMSEESAANLPVTEHLYVPTTGVLTLDYVEVPVLLDTSPLKLPFLPADLDLFAGPTFAVNVISRQEIREYFNDSWHSISSNSSSGIQWFNFNVAIGGGPTFNLGTTKLGIEVRYTFGPWSAVTGPLWNNNVWSIMARMSL